MDTYFCVVAVQLILYYTKNLLRHWYFQYFPPISKNTIHLRKTLALGSYAFRRKVEIYSDPFIITIVTTTENTGFQTCTSMEWKANRVNLRQLIVESHQRETKSFAKTILFLDLGKILSLTLLAPSQGFQLSTSRRFIGLGQTKYSSNLVQALKLFYLQGRLSTCTYKRRVSVSEQNPLTVMFAKGGTKRTSRKTPTSE